MIYDPLRAEGTDDEPWAVATAGRRTSRFEVVARIVLVVIVLVVVALVRHR